MGRLGVITGLAREADCLGYLPNQGTLLVRCAGGCSKRAAEIARTLALDGCHGLVSFGIAGALEASLGPGAVVIPASVIDPDGSRIECDPAWRRRLMSVIGEELPIAGSDVLGVDRAVLSTEEKRRLHERTGAVAVDMESHAVARTAAEHGVSCLVVRAIADPVSRSIPSWVPGLVGSDGRPGIRAVIAGAVRNPLQVPVLVKLGLDSQKAFGSLRRVALSGGLLFEFGA